MVDVVKQEAIDAACDGVMGGNNLHLHGTVRRSDGIRGSV